MFRWLKDRKKNKDVDKRNGNVEDEYGFAKRSVLKQEEKKMDSSSPNGLKSGPKDCQARARMPTPIINVKETSSHIYDEIPNTPVPTTNDLDIVKDTTRQPINLRNAVEVGPYLIVQICDPSQSKSDVEIFKKNTHTCHNVDGDVTSRENESQTRETLTDYTPPWDLKANQNCASNADILKDAKIVLTRCVKSRSAINQMDSTQKNMCSLQPRNKEEKMCSDSKTDFDSESLAESNSRTLTGSPDVEESSNSRTLTGTPDSHAQLETEDNCSSREISEADGNDTCCEYDLSTSGESDLSERSTDYELYLSKIESNLKHKHNVRRIIKGLEHTIHETEHEDSEEFPLDASEIDSMTYVSSLSEYSSARSHLSDEVSDIDCVADQSASDDSSGYYECHEEKQGSPSQNQSHDVPRDGSRVSLERSLSAPDGKSTNVSTKSDFKKYKEKYLHKHKKSQSRSRSFDCSVYTTRSAEDQEMYLLPVNKRSESITSGSRLNRNKPVLAPQPTPVYMEPYRSKTRSHNRLLGDLIRMNYDKQLLIKM